MSAETEELSLTFEDIDGDGQPFTRPVLEDRVEQIVQEKLVYRNAFRPYSATNISSSIVQIPVPKDEMGAPKIVDEGAEFPRSHEEYTLETLEFEKFGFEVPITREAEEDSRISLANDQVDRQAREMAEDINMRAWDAINDGVTKSAGDGGSTLTYEDILAGREALVKDSYNPDLLVAGVTGVHDLMKSNNFLEAGDMQSEMRREGVLGRIAGMDVTEDDSGIGLSGSQALMVDTDYFGYEGTRDPVTTEEYEEKRSQTEVYRIFSRMGWLVSETNAGVLID